MARFVLSSPGEGENHDARSSASDSNRPGAGRRDPGVAAQSRLGICTQRVSAGGGREERRGAGGTAGDYTTQQLAELEDRFTAVERSTAREMEEARERAKDVPDATREKLNAAIEHIETARDNARARLD